MHMSYIYAPGRAPAEQRAELAKNAVLSDRQIKVLVATLMDML
jgi:hypothetical protein